MINRSNLAEGPLHAPAPIHELHWFRLFAWATTLQSPYVPTLFGYVLRFTDKSQLYMHYVHLVD
jgi:hypothetical protein